jgi:hypothetical protein
MRPDYELPPLPTIVPRVSRDVRIEIDYFTDGTAVVKYYWRGMNDTAGEPFITKTVADVPTVLNPVANLYVTLSKERPK